MRELICKFIAALMIAVMLTTSVAYMEETCVEAAVDCDNLTNESIISENTATNEAEPDAVYDEVVDGVVDDVEQPVSEVEDVELASFEGVNEVIPDHPETPEDAEVLLESDWGSMEIGEAEASSGVISEEENIAEKAASEAVGGIPIDAAHYPNKVFRSYVADSFDTDKDGYLSDSERENVKQIIIHSNQYGSPELNDVQGIESFPNLESIWITDTGLVSLSLTGFPKLRSINCMANKLTTLEVSNMPNLSGIWCGGNQLKSLDIANLPKLNDLQCGNNQLTILDISRCPEFATLIRNKSWGKEGNYGSKDSIHYWYIVSDAIPVVGVYAATAISIGSATVTSASSNLGIGGSTIYATGGKAKATVAAAPGSTAPLELCGSIGTKFKSSNRKVATVDKNGNVTFKKAGKVTISYKVTKVKELAALERWKITGKQTRKITLTVVDPTIPSSVTLNLSGTVQVTKGESVTLTATIPAGTNSGIKWKSSNKRVATVKGGAVKFKKAGKVTITAITKRGKKKAKVTFKVSK